MPQGSVKVMLSYDYCHFEIALASDQEMAIEEIDEMRKDAQRLADKAVEQYKIAKQMAELRINSVHLKENFKQQCSIIEKKPEGERTINEIAQLKAYQDDTWQSRFDHDYDYEDNYQEDEF
jgi:hypothetical protein